MKDIEIKPEIRMSAFIKAEDLKSIIAGYLEEKGYEAEKVVFEMKTRCTGYGQGERQETYLDGARVDVKKKE